MAKEWPESIVWIHILMRMMHIWGGILPEAVASGSIVHFNDAAPIVNCGGAKMRGWRLFFPISIRFA